MVFVQVSRATARDSCKFFRGLQNVIAVNPSGPTKQGSGTVLSLETSRFGIHHPVIPN